MLGIFITLLFAFPLLGQIEGNIHIDREEELLEMADQLSLTLAELDAANIDPCAINTNVNLLRIKFKSGVYVSVTSDVFLNQPFLYDELTGLQYSLSSTNGEASAFVNTSTKYQLMAYDQCGNLIQLETLDLTKEAVNAPLLLTPKLYEAIIVWQQQDKIGLYDFIVSESSFTYPEKLFLFQELLGKGEPLLDDFKPGMAIDQFPDRNAREKDICNCKTLQVRGAYGISPAKYAIAGNLIVGDYGSSSKSFRGGGIKTYEAHNHIGPSRYEQLWAQTTECVNAPYVFGINLDYDIDDDVSDPIIPTFNAIVEYNMVCFGESELPDDECGCTRKIQFEAEYNSVVRAQAETISGGLFCGSNRRAGASAEDFAVLSYGLRGESEQFEIAGLMLNGQVRDCSQSYAGPTAAELLTFVYYTYSFIKGSPITTGVPAVDAAIQIAWSTYYSAQAIDAIDDVLDGPWLEYIGNCGGDTQGRIKSIPTTNFTMELKANTPIRAILSAGSRLEVGGLRKWTANARLHSSFRLASLLEGGTLDEYGDYCCFPFAGTSFVHTASEDVNGGPTLASWQNSNQRFFFLQGMDDITVNGHFNHGISSIRQCSTVIILPPFRTRSINEPSSESVNIQINQREVIALPMTEEGRYQVTVFDALGRSVYSDQLQWDNHVGTSLQLQLTNLSSAIYWITLQSPSGTLSSQKFYHHE